MSCPCVQKWCREYKNIIKYKVACIFSPLETISTSLWASRHHNFPVLSVFSHVICQFIFFQSSRVLSILLCPRRPLLLFLYSTRFIAPSAYNSTRGNIIDKIYTHSFVGFCIYVKIQLIDLYNIVCSTRICFSCR